MLKHGDCYCTESSEFKLAELDFAAIKVMSFSDEFYRLWAIGWHRLRARLVDSNSLHKILVNKVFLAHVDDAGDVFEQRLYIDKINAWLARLYERLSVDLDAEQFVDYSGLKFIAKSNHKWGRSPFHFDSNVELHFLKSLKNFSDVHLI